MTRRFSFTEFYSMWIQWVHLTQSCQSSMFRPWQPCGLKKGAGGRSLWRFTQEIGIRKMQDHMLLDRGGTGERGGTGTTGTRSRCSMNCWSTSAKLTHSDDLTWNSWKTILIDAELLIWYLAWLPRRAEGDLWWWHFTICPRYAVRRWLLDVAISECQPFQIYLQRDICTLHSTLLNCEIRFHQSTTKFQIPYQIRNISESLSNFHA